MDQGVRRTVHHGRSDDWFERLSSLLTGFRPRGTADGPEERLTGARVSAVSAEERCSGGVAGAFDSISVVRDTLLSATLHIRTTRRSDTESQMPTNMATVSLHRSSNTRS